MDLFDNPITWAIAGVVSLIAEMVVPFGAFLPFAAAAVITSTLQLLGLLPTSRMWTICFVVILASLVAHPLKLMTKRAAKSVKDINDY